MYLVYGFITQRCASMITDRTNEQRGTATGSFLPHCRESPGDRACPVLPLLTGKIRRYRGFPWGYANISTIIGPSVRLSIWARVGRARSRQGGTTEQSRAKQGKTSPTPPYLSGRIPATWPLPLIVAPPTLSLSPRPLSMFQGFGGKGKDWISGEGGARCKEVIGSTWTP